jgi:hypothetical protein
MLEIIFSLLRHTQSANKVGIRLQIRGGAASVTWTVDMLDCDGGIRSVLQTDPVEDVRPVTPPHCPRDGISRHRALHSA